MTMPLFPIRERVALLVGAFFYLTFLFAQSPAYAACANPAGIPGDVRFNSNYNIFQGCTKRGWMAFNAPDPSAMTGPEGCDNVGQTCVGTYAGMIYAGQFEGHKLYVTGADAPGSIATGGTGSGTYRWNNGNSGENTDIDDLPNCTTGSTEACTGAQGEAFTQILANFTGIGSPYRAASYCYHLGKASDPAGPGNPLAHGRDDWYLPALDELIYLYTSLGPTPNHNFLLYNYWSSTEESTLGARSKSFLNTTTSASLKTNANGVRCVAK